MTQKSLDDWLGHIHEWYPIYIERIKCKRCWYCGETKEVDGPVFLR